MSELITSFYELLLALGTVLQSIAKLSLPIAPLLAWLAFWYYAVDWNRLRGTLGDGAWLMVSLLAALAGMVRLTTSLTPDRLPLLELSVSPYVGVVAEVAVLASTALLAGAAKVSRTASEQG